MEYKIINVTPLIFYSDLPSINNYLTKWKEYGATIQGNYCHVVNDFGQYRKYKLEYFMTIDEYREKIINEILS